MADELGSRDMILYDYSGHVRTYTYGEVFSLCKRYLAFWGANGLKCGDTVAVVLPNAPETIIAFFSAILAGIHFAPLPCTVTGREMRNWTSLVHPKLILKKDGLDDLDTSEIPTVSLQCDGSFAWLPEQEGVVEKADAHIYLYTSGSTGAPKAMQISADRLWSSGKAFVAFYGIENKKLRFWNYLPMSYLGGLYNLALIPMSCGGSFVISEPFSGKTVLNYWGFVRKHAINALWLVPSIVRGLLKLRKLIGGSEKKSKRSDIEIAFLGTAPIQLDEKREFEEVFGIRLYENFALSESTFLTAESERNIRFREQGSVGEVLPYADIKLDPILGAENLGTIWLKTPFLFDGYLSENGALELETDDEGYFNSKDLGYFNDDHVLVLCGRSRDIIKKGGLFVSLTEVENAVMKIDSVEEAAGLAVAHDFYGEDYVLCVKFKNGADECEETKKLRMWMIESFVPYKRAEKIICRTDFPRTASGKLKKEELRKELIREGLL